MRCGSPPSLRDRVAHRGEIDDGGNAGEVLEQHAAVRKAISFSTLPFTSQRRHRLDVGRLHEGAVLVPEQILEEDLEAEGEAVAVAAGRSPLSASRR